MSIDNFRGIHDFIEFESEDDFYFLQILKRKKDIKKKVKGSNNNNRLIKAYYITSREHLLDIKNEVIELCKLFEARANINLNRRSWKKSHFYTIQKIVEQLTNEDYKHTPNAFNHVCGKYHNEKNKKWLLDIDVKLPLESRISLDKQLHGIEPVGDKLLTNFPSKNGLHLITKPFNLQQAQPIIEKYEIEIHKNNPTNLYIP